jgi:hypothetical protein
MASRSSRDLSFLNEYDLLNDYWRGGQNVREKEEVPLFP